MMDCSNKSVLVGKQVHLHHKKDISGKVIGTVSAADLDAKAVMSGMVTGYDAIGLVIEFAEGAMTLMTWDALAAYRLVFTGAERS